MSEILDELVLIENPEVGWVYSKLDLGSCPVDSALWGTGGANRPPVLFSGGRRAKPRRLVAGPIYWLVTGERHESSMGLTETVL